MKSVGKSYESMAAVGTFGARADLIDMKRLFPPVASATYDHVTGHVSEQMSYFMIDARRHAGIDALMRRERAYGLYMGWRALAVEMTNAAQFARDDRRLEALLA
jgi:hypothetical protein